MNFTPDIPGTKRRIGPLPALASSRSSGAASALLASSSADSSVSSRAGTGAFVAALFFAAPFLAGAFLAGAFFAAAFFVLEVCAVLTPSPPRAR